MRSDESDENPGVEIGDEGSSMTDASTAEYPSNPVPKKKRITKWNGEGTKLHKVLNNKYVRIIILALAVYFFIVSIKLMGSGFKGLGADFADELIRTTSNPLVGLFIGILATSLIQSSSATTSITVALVASNPAFLPNAIPIIMGANIGTSVTNTLVSLGHIGRATELKNAFSAAVVHDIFNLMAVSVLFPVEMGTRAIWGTGFLEGLASRMADGIGGSSGFTYLGPVEYAVKPLSEEIIKLCDGHYWVAVVIGLVILFITLKLLVDSLKWLAETRVQKIIDRYLFGRAATAFAFGILLTALVQSSSITTSFAVPMVGGGLLTLEQIFPFTLGANIGTTVTAGLAALATAEPAAVTLAFVHLMFNVTGTVLIYPFKRIPIGAAKRLGGFIAKNPKFAIFYIIILFYIIPGVIIGISRLW